MTLESEANNKTEQNTTQTPNNTTTHTTHKRRSHNPGFRTSTFLLSPSVSRLSLLLGSGHSSLRSSPCSSTALGGGRSCLIQSAVLFACSLVSLVFTCVRVSFAFLFLIRTMYPHNNNNKGVEGNTTGRTSRGGGYGGRGGWWGNGLNVRGKEAGNEGKGPF